MAILGINSHHNKIKYVIFHGKTIWLLNTLNISERGLLILKLVGWKYKWTRLLVTVRYKYFSYHNANPSCSNGWLAEPIKSEIPNINFYKYLAHKLQSLFRLYRYATYLKTNVPHGPSSVPRVLRSMSDNWVTGLSHAPTSVNPWSVASVTHTPGSATEPRKLTHWGLMTPYGVGDLGQTLVQAMACCLTATSHCLNQCWLIISKVLWHSSDDIAIRRFEDTNQ